MPQFLKFTDPLMRAIARFHANNTRQQIDHERSQLLTSDLLSKRYVSALIYTVDLKHILGQANPDRRNHHDRLLLSEVNHPFHCGTLILTRKRASIPLIQIGGTLNIKHVRVHWDEILRLATSIKQGTVTASLMLRELGSYPRQNGLAVALREQGRIERSLFILDWLQSVELRRRVDAGLNKGEARNALARAVFFNGLGEIRDRSFEQQRYRASGLNLVMAAIVLWNTVYLERAANALRGHGQAVDDALLQYLSPLGWEHINLTGD